jgi:serine/threonine protein kinase
MRLACEVPRSLPLRVQFGCLNHPSRLTACSYSSNQNNDNVIFKSVRHFRLKNELDVLRRFQSKTRYIRPLLDEIEEPPAIILRYLEDYLLQSSSRKRLSRPEVKFVARRVLQALDVLHSDGFVHTGSLRYSTME